MIEKIVFMQTEDGIVTFEKENRDTIYYPIAIVPPIYNEGDIIKVIIHENDFIEFLELDIDEMDSRHERLKERKNSLRKRAKRSTNKR